MLKPRKGKQSSLSLLHPRFDAQRLSYLVFTDERGVSGRVALIIIIIIMASCFTWGTIRCL